MGLPQVLSYWTPVAMKTLVICLAFISFNTNLIVSPKYLLVETEQSKGVGHEKSDTDYTETLGQWASSLTPKYLNLYNNLDAEGKLKAEQLILKEFGNDKKKVMEAAKTGKLVEFFKNKNDYLMDVYLEQGPGCKTCGRPGPRPTGPPPQLRQGDGCFPASAKVVTIDGVVFISDLKMGDKVMTYQAGTGTIFTKFLGWLDRHSTKPKTYVTLQTQEEGKNVSVTPNHVLFTISEAGKLKSTYAADIKSGDRLAHWTGSGLEGTEVVAVKKWKGDGYWSPLTKEGTLLVDGGFLASCFSSYPHMAGQLSTSLRWIPSMSTLVLDDEMSQEEDGERQVTKMAKVIMNSMGQRWSVKKIDDITQKMQEVSSNAKGLENMEGTIKHLEF